MSDTYTGAPAQLTAPSSALTAPSALAPGLDLGQIDRNFRRVTQLEQATRLPALPDLVKLDLIQSPGADEDSLTEMLLGLDDAYNNRTQQAAQVGQTPSTGVPEPGQSGGDQTRIIIAALTGNKAPRQVDPDAVKNFKLRAINQGLLDMDPRRVDNSWSPEFNRLRGEMAYDDYNAQMRGDHPGATTFERAMGLLGEFTSPAGLLHMATELDLFWDFGAIGHEISTWGDKWRAVGKSKNPLDFGAKLIDALTGPIDDIVFPVINDALLFTGVGSMFNSARVGWQGARLLEEGAAFSRLFEGSGRVGRFYDFIAGGGARNLIEMREPGLIASRLQNFEGIPGGIGKGMAAWRDLTPVVAGKQAVQTGMRLGFAAALENRFPGYNSDGLSISDLPGGAAAGNALQNTEEALARGAIGAIGGVNMPAGIVAAGVVTTGLELMFAPYNIFSPGTFFRHGTEGLGALSGIGRAGAGALGTAPGRAVAGAGVGALAGAIGGESTEATVEGALAGAAVGAGAPVIGHLLQNAQVRQGVIGALLGATGGTVLGEDPRMAAITGAIAGVGMAYLPTNVRNAVFAQAGIHGLDKLLEGTGQRMVRTSFQMIERDQHVAVGWYRLIRRSLLTEPDQLAQWENDVRSLGVVGAWAAKKGIDREVAAAEITWEYSNAAVDWIAGRQAALVTGGATEELMDLARNKLLAQLRPIDIGENIPVENVIADVASRMAWQNAGGVDGNLDKVRDLARRWVADLTATPEQAYKMAAEHNAKAGDTIAQLWDPRNFPDATYVPRRQRNPGMAEWATQPWRSREDVFVDYAAKHLDRLGGYSKYTPAMESIRQARAAGLFDEVSMKLATDRFGRQVDPRTMKVPRDPQAVKVNEAIGDIMTGHTPVEPAAAPDPFAAPAPAAAAPAGPRALTPEEIAAGHGDVHTPTAAEVQAATDMAKAAHAQGITDLEWYAPHEVGANPNRLGPIRLPKGTPAPPGYYNIDAAVGPVKLRQDLGLQVLGNVSNASGRMDLASDLWNLGYRDAAEVNATGLTPDEIVAQGVKPAAAAPAAPAAPTAPAAPAAPRLIDPAKVPGLDPISSGREAGRITAMRIDELAKHEVRSWAERVADVVDTARHLSDAQKKNWSSVLDIARMEDTFAAARLAGSEVTDRQLVEMIQQATKAGVNRKSIKALVKFAQRHGVGPAALDTTLRRMADDLLNDAAWETHGFGRIVRDENGRELKGMDALERRLKQLREREPQTAAEVDIDGMIARAEATSFDEVDSHDFSWARDIGGPPIRNAETGLMENAETVRVRQAREQFGALPDDALVTVYHTTSKANAESLLAGRSIDPAMAGSNTGATRVIPGELYVTGAKDPLGRFGDTTLAITVRKGDINISPEAMTTVDFAGISEAEAVGHAMFTLPGQGAVLRDLNDVADIRLVDKGGSVKVKVPKPDSQAAELRQLRDGLAGRGYKLVHGVQFLMPEDLSFNIPTFTDVTRRHMNAVTHGNWFGRRPPIEARILDDRRRKVALADELSKVGTDLSPEDEQIVHILDNLESHLRQEQDDVARRLNTSHMRNEGFISKTLDRVKSSFTPVRVDDLGGFRKGTPERVREALETMNLSAEEEQAVVRAINRFRNTDFHDMGLFAIENHLRSRSQAAGFLKMLGGTKYGGRVTGTVRQTVTGGLVGGAIGAATAGSEASFEDRLKGALQGGLAGGIVGGAVSGAVNVADASKGIIQTAEDFRYGYLADMYARLRDSMRFTLSPFFDLSRYTEGMMLSQAAAPLRDSAGHRLVTPLNASPSRLRTRIARQLTKDAEAAGETLTKAEATERAANRYNRWMDEFNTATRQGGDFDVDAIDSAGQWFRQVGILGFSPTDWMATAFANMRGTGMDAETAYHAAREMYQYGTRGRSAAELSVNFIFFPFSFQKKALTHIGEWLNDDLGRSIMVHDALKTYEVLDEKYNLQEYWKEHVPFMTQLGRLNLFAYGLSPGRLGGINSQLLESLGKPALNMFLPAGVKIRDASMGKELTDLGKQLLPVLNDINWMSHDMREIVFPELRAGAQRIQGVETPMAMESYRAQVTDGWEEFNAYRTDFESYLAGQGYTTSDVMNDRNDWLAPLKAEYERKVNEIATRYPAWWASKLEAPGNAIALQMEKQNRIVAAEVAVRAGQRPSPDNFMVAQMQAFIDQAEQQVELITGSTNLDFAPAETFDRIHQMAAEFATQNPGFVDLWNKFWRHDFGDLTSPMRLSG